MQQYSLSEFNTLVKKVLSKQLDPSYWIVAEIGQISIASKGHCYLELVEKEDNFIKAKIRANIWANKFNKLHDWFVSITGTPLKEGMKILINASMTFHEVYGVSININDIDASFTLGEREKKKRETIKQLEAEGIIDMNANLPLPLIVQNIAIISSETAAGYEDFVNQFENNPYGYVCKFSLYPSMMQGDQAPASIIESLHQIYERESEYDAVILIRGGGSQIDLDCFDDYNLCAHLAQFPLPIITGIGHERDESIADKVAHTPLKTPTSVAEFLLSKMSQFEAEMHTLMENISRSTQMLLHQNQEALQNIKFQIRSETKQLLDAKNYMLSTLKENIYKSPIRIVHQKQVALEALKKLVDAFDPKHVLKKGYSLTKLNGKLLNGQNVKAGDKLETITDSKLIISTVDKIK
jgi:exodeoxyribonuclease VII large subunit